MATKVEPTIRWDTPGGMPNGLQATDDGLWVIDQIDPNKIFLLDYEQGEILREFQTRALHSSGITVDDNGNLWVASTRTYEMICFDSSTGEEIVAYPTPPYDQSGGAHGTEWRDGRLWFNLPKTGLVYVMNPANGKIEHQIPCHGNRAHGMAWDPYDGNLWCVDTNKRVMFKLSPDDGDIVDALGVSGPEPHGLTVWQGQFWLCDATSPTARTVWTFDVPKPATGV
jgi:sugar lactone lactonase YvrE